MSSLLANRRSASSAYVPPVTGTFVSPSATVYGDGSFYDPLQLQIALNNASAGDTLWLRGGTYTGAFTSSAGLHGSSSNRITVRSYPGEWAVIDSAQPTGSPLIINGDYWTVRDIEITNSDTSRSRVLDASVPYDSEWRPTGLIWNGDYGEHINLLVHDNGNGISWFTQAAGGLSYGNIIWNNGWAGSSNMRGHGHGWYTQNDHANNSPKYIRNSISTNSCGSACKIGAQNGHVDDYTLDSCTLSNSGAPVAMTNLFDDNYRIQNLNHGSGEFPAVNLEVTKTRMYEIGGSVGAGLQNNYAGVLTCSGLSLKDNYISAGAVDGVLLSNGWTDANVENNIAHGNGIGPGNEILSFVKSVQPTGAWDNNAYYTNGATYNFNYPAHVGQVNFANWKSGTGFDTNSTLAIDSNPPDKVYVDTNNYEIGRSHVTIYNWTDAVQVAVDLGSTGLVNGDPYYIFNAMNPLAGPVASGTYTGVTVAFPMTDGVVGAPANPVGDLPAGPQTAPIFGCFLVRKFDSVRRAA